ncbi:ROK family transcriptional regulator [Paenibacillus solani]|uniref:ROK family transcriptional regulator n=1 Tax=Paenibacillus solani TaxID=1705565 RepID=UPI003D28FAE1
MNNSVGKNNRHVRNMNRIGVISLLRDYGSLTKAEIAAKMDLTFTAVNNLVEELMQEGWIMDAGYDVDAYRGRKPKLISLNPDDIYTIGVHVDPTFVRAGVMNLQGNMIMEERRDFEDNANRGSVVNVIISTIQAVLDQSELKSRIIGIGIAAPGPLDPIQGKILSPPNIPGLHQVRLKGLIEENTELPTYMEKDANAMALGEQWYGNGRHFNSMLYVNADMSIGSGLILDQKLYRVSPFGAGEIGHCTIDMDGPRCYCGNHGCLDAMASGMAIINSVNEKRLGTHCSHESSLVNDQHGLNMSDLIPAAHDGDPNVVQCLINSAQYVGIALANIMNLLTPETIIIGGSLANQYPDFFEHVKETAYKRSLSSFHNQMVLQPSELGEHAGMVGAGTIVFEKYLSEMGDKE